MECTVQELADRAGISGRTLRHYHQIGLLAPDRIGANGYRYYGPTAVARLQRILLLRETGLGLAAIGEALATDTNPQAEITAHWRNTWHALNVNRKRSCGALLLSSTPWRCDDRDANHAWT